MNRRAWLCFSPDRGGTGRLSLPPRTRKAAERLGRERAADDEEIGTEVSASGPADPSRRPAGLEGRGGAAEPPRRRSDGSMPSGGTAKRDLARAQPRAGGAARRRSPGERSGRGSRGCGGTAAELAGPPAVEPPPASVLELLRLLEDRKAIEPVLLDVRQVAGFTSYLLIASGNSRTQVEAMADALVRARKVPGQRGIPVEADQGSTWVLVDLGEVVVHLFQPDARRFYDLESLWADAIRITPP